MGRNGLFKDMTGQRCHRLLVVSRAPNRNGQAWWNCICDCGRSLEIFGRSLRDGGAKSCGCFSRDRAKTLSKTHGMTHRSEYKIWIGIKKRCENPQCPAYPSYGGRGIYLDIEFQNFERFFAHVGPRPINTSLDRINNDGPYAPGNVRWATRKVQARNSRHNHLITIGDKTQPISAWCEENGIRQGTASMRLHYGWNEVDAVTLPAGGAFGR